MFFYASHNDNTRQLGGAIDFTSYRVPPTEKDEQERIGSFLRFRERYMPSLFLNPRNAYFMECETDAMQPYFGKGDWMVIDRSVQRIRSEQIYVIRFPDLRPHIQYAAEPRDVVYCTGGLKLRCTNKTHYDFEEFVPAEEVHKIGVIGVVKSIFKNPYR